MEQIVVPLFSRTKLLLLSLGNTSTTASHAQQLVIIVIEGVIVASMNTGFWYVLFLHIDHIHFRVSFPQTVFLPALERSFCVIGEFSASDRWNARLHNFLLESSSVQWYSDRESMACHIKQDKWRSITGLYHQSCGKESDTLMTILVINNSLEFTWKYTSAFFDQMWQFSPILK